MSEMWRRAAPVPADLSSARGRLSHLSELEVLQVCAASVVEWSTKTRCCVEGTGTTGTIILPSTGDLLSNLVFSVVNFVVNGNVVALPSLPMFHPDSNPRPLVVTGEITTFRDWGLQNRLRDRFG